MCSNIEDAEPLDTQLKLPTELGSGNPQSVISIVEIKEDFEDKVDVVPIVLQKTHSVSLEEKRKELKRKKTNARQRAYYQRQKDLKKNEEIIKTVPKSNAERQRKFRQRNAEKSYMDMNGAVTEMWIVPACTIPSTTAATDRSGHNRQPQTNDRSRKRRAQATKRGGKRQPHGKRSQLQATATTSDTTGNSDALDTQKETSIDNIHEGDVFIANNVTMVQATTNLKRKAKTNETIIHVKIIVDESTQAASSSEHENIIISTNTQPDDNNCETEEVSLFCEDNMEFVDEIAQHEVVSKKHDTEPSRYYVINDDGEIAQVNSNVDLNTRQPSSTKKVVVKKNQIAQVNSNVDLNTRQPSSTKKVVVKKNQSVEIVMCKCELKCNNKFTQQERQTIFNEFAKLKIIEQNNLVRCLVTKRKRQVSNQKRQVSDQKRQVSDKMLTPNSVTGSSYTYQLPSPNGDDDRYKKGYSE